MKYSMRPSPNYNQKQSTKSIMFELTLGLLVVYAFSLFFYFTNEQFGSAYGNHILAMMAISVSVCVLTEVVWAMIMKKPVIEYLTGSFPWVTGIIITLIMPVNLSLYAIAVSSFLAILLGKLVFGGFGQNIFNPAGVARGVVFSSFATATVVDLVAGATPVSTFNGMGWVVNDNNALMEVFNQFGGVWNILIGWHPGSIGETSALLIIIIGIYFAIRNIIDWRIPVVYVGTIFVLTLIVGLMNGLGIMYPLYHILTGGVMFGAVFMLTDPVTNPTSASGRVVFALGAAILTVLLRLMSNMPEGVVFSILLMNALTPLIESAMDGQQVRSLKKYRIVTATLVVIGLGLSVIMGNNLVAVEAANPETETPSIKLNDEKTLISSDEVTQYTGEIMDQKDEGNIRTYTVKVNGYGMVDDDGSHGMSYEPHEIAIQVNMDSKTLESIEYVVFGDTPGIGDATQDEAYYEVYQGLSLTDYQQGIDTVSGATRTSLSMISAVRIVMDDLNK